jgi:hypothetical protein
MSQNFSENFWLENPRILITNACKFNPIVSFTYDKLPENMNAYTRFIIIFTIIIFCITGQSNYIFIGIFLILVIIIMYYSIKKDAFNIIPNDFSYVNDNDNENNNTDENTAINKLKKMSELPKRKSDYYNTNVNMNNPLKNVLPTDYGKEQEYSKATISDSSTSRFVDGKIFQTSDQWIFDKNTQPFYTTANSSVPNDQTSFANWLYGTENICKEGSIYLHRTGTPKQTLNCNGFNVSTPTNFGNLNDDVYT